ncbi:uncharacterized protein LOC134191880 isoform X2 [Corticium candelabrum]|uniref:uncharacterized protein LOC134191880 isoform X2 n=1 Tax=Corticium candelabrum TaxID=121492 RepID=UPI002E2563EF|nr:uncharacterized protein LOC134191880 isoform X2 [Corticium candelabrum]
MDDEHMQAAKIRRENRSRSFDSGTIRHSVDANLTALHSEQTTSSLRPSRRTNKRAFSESGLSGKKLGSVQGRRREIDLLRFHSPGPRLLADFNPETSDRELRKLKRLTTLDRLVDVGDVE